MERLTQKNVKLSMIKNIPHEKFYYELEKYENFLEENGFENLEDLKNRINSWVKDEKQVETIAKETIQKYLNSIEFQKMINDLSLYKVMWQKLKQYLNEDITNAEYYWKIMSIMEKLEKEE